MRRFPALVAFLSAPLSVFAQDGVVDLAALPNYAHQGQPGYIAHDNTPDQNPLSDIGATLGRILFYDKRLSRNNTISCASCHQQAHGFGDASIASPGVAGKTGRHTMRVSNIKFGNEPNYFWDER